MSGPTAIALGALLVAIFIVLAGAMLWQELRSRSLNDPTEFIITDAVQWIWQNLNPDVRDRVGLEKVTATVEWQIHQLQQSVRGQTRGDAETVMGATEPMVEYIRGVIGSDISTDDIRSVLEAQSGYLISIGAVAGVVEDGGEQ